MIKEHPGWNLKCTKKSKGSDILWDNLKYNEVSYNYILSLHFKKRYKKLHLIPLSAASNWIYSSKIWIHHILNNGSFQLVSIPTQKKAEILSSEIIGSIIIRKAVQRKFSLTLQNYSRPQHQIQVSTKTTHYTSQRQYQRTCSSRRPLRCFQVWNGKALVRGYQE